jgi:O-acetyl-ADP-ribose deacetylase (regulator of RNase III)
LAKLKQELPIPKGSAGELSLAFPSFSTSTFQFDVDKAAQIACKVQIISIVSHIYIKVISEFLEKNNNVKLKLILVENSESICRAFKKVLNFHLYLTVQYYTSGDSRFVIKSGDISKMKSTVNMPCRFIANECNWRLKAGGSGTNKSIFEAAGPSFEEETHKRLV